MKYLQRGFSVAEVLTVTVILAMLLAAMVAIIPLMMHSPLQMQSQVDQVNAAAIALYKIRRDFSEGDISGVMGCTTAPVVSCDSASTSMESVQAMAVVTAENNVGAFQVDGTSGYPLWQGFYVYWLVPNQAGTAYDLMRAFEPAPACPVVPPPGCVPVITVTNGVPNNVTPTMVNPLVTAALALTPPPVLTNNIVSMSLGEQVGSSTVQFELNAGAFAGANQAETTFQSNTYARN